MYIYVIGHWIISSLYSLYYELFKSVCLTNGVRIICCELYDGYIYLANNVIVIGTNIKGLQS